MIELIIKSKVVKFNNPTQIINMGGPWVGVLFIGDFKIMDNVIIDNLFYSKEDDKLYFVRYHKISKWGKENYFTICYFDLSTNKLYMFDMKFEMVFIKEININSDLIYYEAFHDHNESRIKRQNLGNAIELLMDK